MRQEPPEISGTRAEFAVDDIPYVFTADADGQSVFVYAVIGALPQDASAKSRVFAGLLRAQFCFSESCGSAISTRRSFRSCASRSSRRTA